LTPQDFVAKWRHSTLKESAGAQEHFIDLCRLLGEKTPGDADGKGDWYTFEKGAAKTGGGDGWADVWKRNCFAWEYKGKGKNLDQALKQLKLYQGALDNPPLLIVSDMEKIEIHTAWTNMVQEKHVFTLDDLIDGRRRSLLKKAFSETAVEDLKPGKKRSELTAEVAQEFVTLAQSLRERGHAADKVAHFVNRMVFCMFAEDVDLLTDKLFKRMLEASVDDPDSFVDNARKLFAAMAKPNGKLDFRKIEWFNGGLFDDENALPLTRSDIQTALKAANQDWSNIDPSIMGTLFERGLDPDKRSQLGAHYTDPDKIMMIINPVIIEPLMREWEGTKAEITAEFAKVKEAREARPTKGANAQRFYQGQRQREENALRRERELFGGFLDRLKQFRVLDPACGSGNFLYLGLKALKDIELRANQDHEALSLAYDVQIGVYAPGTGPENMLGIEINPFAVELARVSVWIGEIQWMREHGFDASRNPILKPLETIRCHDALLNEDGSEYEWPTADAIIGNPPFLGAKLMKGRLGVDETEKVRAAFYGRLPGFTDFVCYWFEKSRAQMESGKVARAGLVATKAIAKNTNLPVMRRIAELTEIYDAWSNEPWIQDGAAVRVAIVCFGTRHNGQLARLNGEEVERINPNLTTGRDISVAEQLEENNGVCFLGIQKSGPFDVSGQIARGWLTMSANPNGRPNSDVLKPYLNWEEVAENAGDRWIIDFPRELTEAQASLYQAPFDYLRRTQYDPASELDRRTLREARENARDDHARTRWWELYWPRPEMRRATQKLTRYLVTGETSEHRVFVWLCPPVLPDKNLIVFAREDDFFLGILQSATHEAWATSIGNRMGVGNQRRYNASYIFETFPFPDGLAPNVPLNEIASEPRALTVAAAAKNLSELREKWLHPSDLLDRVPEVVPGFPFRSTPKNLEAAAALRGRTLANLYNERPAWLDLAHKELDRAVAAAYGWADWGADGLPADVILERLFKLNQERAAAGIDPMIAARDID
jgi:type II restriction/modification system DNA methylase subunit YeeA